MFQRVKGTEDFLPLEFAQQSVIFNKLRNVAKKYGYLEVNTPAIESLNLLTAKSGEEVKQQIFTFEKKGSEELGLRFDLTVPMARLFVSKQKELQKPVKWFSIDNMWRYEAPQKGRDREFFQLSVEQFGASSVYSDAEVLLLLIDCFKHLGFSSKDVVVKINSREILEALLSSVVKKDLIEDVFRLVDKSSKITDAEFTAALKRHRLDAKAIKKIKEIISLKGPARTVLKKIKVPKEFQLCLEHFKKALSLLPQEWVVVDLSIARGLAYYTGLVFECFDRNGLYRALAGGGRYDRMIELFDGESCPAAGFGIGFSTTRLFMQEKGLLPEVSIAPRFVVAPVNDSVREKALEITQLLRTHSSAVVDISDRKLSKQFEFANSLGAEFVVIVGPQELKRNKVKLREMKTGKEKEVSLKDLLKI